MKRTSIDDKYIHRNGGEDKKAHACVCLCGDDNCISCHHANIHRFVTNLHSKCLRLPTQPMGRIIANKPVLALPSLKQNLGSIFSLIWSHFPPPFCTFSLFASLLTHIFQSNKYFTKSISDSLRNLLFITQNLPCAEDDNIVFHEWHVS